MVSVREMSSEEVELHDYKQNLESKKKERAIIKVAREGYEADKKASKEERWGKVKSVGSKIFGGIGTMAKSAAAGGKGMSNIGNNLFGSTPRKTGRGSKMYSGYDLGFNTDLLYGSSQRTAPRRKSSRSSSSGYVIIKGKAYKVGNSKKQKRRNQPRSGGGGFNLGFDLGGF